MAVISKSELSGRQSSSQATTGVFAAQQGRGRQIGGQNGGRVGPQLFSRLPLRGVWSRLLSLSALRHVLAAAGSIVALGVANAILTAAYEASGFPVPFAVGQTAFDGQTIKGYYAVLQELGTMDVYLLTQMIDFGFMAAIAFFGIAVASLLVRGFGVSSKLGRVAQIAGAAIVVGAAFDALENFFSFVMLAQPSTFPDWLAFPYSASAVIKFGFEVSGILALGALAVVWPIMQGVQLLAGRSKG